MDGRLQRWNRSADTPASPHILCLHQHHRRASSTVAITSVYPSQPHARADVPTLSLSSSLESLSNHDDPSRPCEIIQVSTGAFFLKHKEQRIEQSCFDWTIAGKATSQQKMYPLLSLNTPWISQMFEKKTNIKGEEEWVSAGWPGRYVYVFTVQVCGLVEHALCVCGNYSNLNAGSAGETGCLLINEPSRWPRVGVSCECTVSRSGGQRNNDTWAIVCLCARHQNRTHIIIFSLMYSKCRNIFFFFLQKFAEQASRKSNFSHLLPQILFK